MHTITSVDAAARPAARRWPAFLALLGPALRSHAPLYALLGLHLAAAVALVAFVPAVEAPDPGTAVLSMVAFLCLILPLSLICLRFVHVARNVRPKHPIPALARDLWAFTREPDRAANGLAIMVAFAGFMTAFSFLKASIPLVQPFDWDTTFHAWDRWLHFGHDPWRLLQPVLGYPVVTFLINISYHLWFMVMWILVAWLAFARVPSALRLRFFLAFMLSWTVGGNLLATIFSSAGPCYYALLGLTPDPYAPLMAYLEGVDQTLPIWALKTQALLWEGYQGRGVDLGISAMPSMHNAAALLFALVGRQLDRRLGRALFAFAALIFVGSVHLGWHYAIDGYAGFAVALASWWAAGLVASRWDRTSWSRAHREAATRLCAGVPRV